MRSYPFSWEFPYAWPRKPVLAQNVVATSQPLAAQAGLRMLLDGGSAVDAIVATAITLTLVEPVSNGIGSDAFAIVWDGDLHGYLGSGRSPAKANIAASPCAERSRPKDPATSITQSGVPEILAKIAAVRLSLDFSNTRSSLSSPSGLPGSSSAM